MMYCCALPVPEKLDAIVVEGEIAVPRSGVDLPVSEVEVLPRHVATDGPPADSPTPSSSRSRAEAPTPDPPP